MLALFVDSESLTSQTALHNLDLALEGTEYKYYTAVLEAKYHTALLTSYKIYEFPTVLLLDESSEIIVRETRVRNMTEHVFRQMLQAIHHTVTNPL